MRCYLSLKQLIDTASERREFNQRYPCCATAELLPVVLDSSAAELGVRGLSSVFLGVNSAVILCGPGYSSARRRGTQVGELIAFRNRHGRDKGYVCDQPIFYGYEH